ncbi:MAG: response regulator [Geobacter sp.]|nr:response regulator [Geobacter sp.]
MGYRLLLADDSITIQKVVGIIFANSEYDLTIVDNGDAALAKARETAPDIMLVDALMPGKNGYEVCEEVRRDPRLKDVPILLLTGAFEPFDEAKARQSGADDFISKPFESQQLIDKVSNLIELGKLRTASATAAIQPPVVEAAPSVQTAQPLTEPLAAELEAAFAQEGTVKPEPLTLGEFDIVEVSPEEDLWGVLEAEEAAEGEIEFGEVVTEAEEGFAEEPLAMVEPEPADLFAEEPIAEAEQVPEDIFSEDMFAPPEEAIFFAAEEVAAPASTPEVKPVVPTEEYSFQEAAVAEAFSFEEPESSQPAETAFEFAPPEEAFVASPVAEAAPPAIEQPLAPSAAGLTDEQIASLVSRISRELIEKIAWEVVPDLAESIIRDEIRKIKEGN